MGAFDVWGAGRCGGARWGARERRKADENRPKAAACAGIGVLAAEDAAPCSSRAAMLERRCSVSHLA
jgi:hypothetical protein